MHRNTSCNKENELLDVSKQELTELECTIYKSPSQSHAIISDLNWVESMMRKILEGQQNMVVDFKKKLDFVYIELNGKFEFLNTYGKELNIQVQQINEVVKRDSKLKLGVDRQSNSVDRCPTRQDPNTSPNISIDRHSYSVDGQSWLDALPVSAIEPRPIKERV
ncbi:hypothetical protein F2Q68_00002199 [Brassica cretica]|uniref:Uncharacterized protein n=1 Tax=Brassica cretica TaxID=69181 RepID=A0A8S9JB21_BRACR|nr:hypothetical protein F2Q68_00002199 [Brassica cretica]